MPYYFMRDTPLQALEQFHRDCQNQQAKKRAYYVKNTLRYQV